MIFCSERTLNTITATQTPQPVQIAQCTAAAPATADDRKIWFAGTRRTTGTAMLQNDIPENKLNALATQQHAAFRTVARIRSCRGTETCRGVPVQTPTTQSRSHDINIASGVMYYVQCNTQARRRASARSGIHCTALVCSWLTSARKLLYVTTLNQNNNPVGQVQITRQDHDMPWCFCLAAAWGTQALKAENIAHCNTAAGSIADVLAGILLWVRTSRGRCWLGHPQQQQQQQRPSRQQQHN
jgi:hypothetical protein